MDDNDPVQDQTEFDNAGINDKQFRGGTEKGTLPWIYWRRADGYITISPGWATEVARMTESKGMQPLRRYGEFFMQGGGYKVNGQSNQMPGWTPNRDPYRLILMLGGAKEFPVEQVVENGWHRKPPQGVKFPQLAGAHIADVACPSCRKKFAAVGATDEAAQARANMLRQNHESVMHTTTATQTAQARLTAEAMAGVTGPVGDAIRMLAESQDAMMKQMRQQGDVLAALLRERQEPDERRRRAG